MGMTIAEKTLAGAASVKNVVPGEYVNAKIDRIIGSHNAVKMQADAISAGFTDGIPRVWDRERVHIYLEHIQPALTPEHAKSHQMMRKMGRKVRPPPFQGFPVRGRSPARGGGMRPAG